MEYGAWAINRLAAGAVSFLAAVSPAAADDTMQQSFAREMAEAHMRMHRDMARQMSGNVDGDFLQMMIPHHQGAIDMALILLKYGNDERLKRLAQSIVIEQSQEIAYMRSLLSEQSRQMTNNDGHSMTTKE